jgi:predicted nucleic acid-binding Zn ribbon protein
MSPGGIRGKSDDGPRRVSETLDAVVRRIAPQNAGEFGAVFGHWEEIVGPALAAHVRPIRVTEDALVVAADHPAWATQVKALGSTVLAQVGEVAGRAPGRLEVVVRRS